MYNKGKPIIKQIILFTSIIAFLFAMTLFIYLLYIEIL